MKNKMKKMIDEERNQPKLTQYMKTIKKPEEDDEEKLEPKKPDEAKEEAAGNGEDKNRKQEDRQEEIRKWRRKPEESLTRTLIDDKPKPDMEKPSPLEQPQIENETSVKYKIMAFTQKFNIPPSNTVPPRPPKSKSETAPSSQNRRRPSNIETAANARLERGEGKQI